MIFYLRLILPLLVAAGCKTTIEKGNEPLHAQIMKRVTDNDGTHFEIEVPGSPGGHVLQVCSKKEECQAFFVNEETISLKGIPPGSYKVNLRSCNKAIEAVCDKLVFEDSFTQDSGRAQTSIAGDTQYQILMAKNDAALQFYAAIFRHYTAVTLCKNQGKLDDNLKGYYEFLTEMAQLGAVLGTASINAIFAEDSNAVASLKTSLGAELTAGDGSYRVVVINYTSPRSDKLTVFRPGSWMVDWSEIFFHFFPDSSAHSSFTIEKFENGRWTTDFFFSFPWGHDFKGERPEYAEREERRFEFDIKDGEKGVVKFKEWLRKSEYAPTPGARQDKLKEDRRSVKQMIGRHMDNRDEMKVFSRKYKSLIKKGSAVFKPYIEAIADMERKNLLNKDKGPKYIFNGGDIERYKIVGRIEEIYRLQALNQGTPALDDELKKLLDEERKALVWFSSSTQKWHIVKDGDEYAKMHQKFVDARVAAYKNTWFLDFKTYKNFATAKPNDAPEAVRRLQYYMKLESETAYFSVNRQTSQEREVLQTQLYEREKALKFLFGIPEADSMRRYFGYDGDLWRMAPPEVIAKDLYGINLNEADGPQRFMDAYKVKNGRGFGNYSDWYAEVRQHMEGYEKVAADLHPKTKAFGSAYDEIFNNCSKGAALALNQLTGTQYFLRRTDWIMTPGKLGNRAAGFQDYIDGKPSLSKKVMTPANLGLAALIGLTIYTIASNAALTEGGDAQAMQCFVDDKETFNEEITDVFNEMSRIRTGQALSEQLQNL